MKSDQMIEHEYVEKDVLKLRVLKQRGFSPNVIFDVGASTGTWSFEIAKVFPEAKFYLFEPLADHADHYRDSLKAIMRTHPQFELRKTAIGARDSTVTLYMTADAYSSTTLSDGKHINIKTINAPLLALSTAIEKGELPVPQFVKVDIQGGEWEALKGLQPHLNQIEILLLETWLVGGYGPENVLLPEICNWLIGFGFYLADFTGEYRTEEGVLYSQDCIFINRKSPLATTNLRTDFTPRAGPPLSKD